MNLNRVYPVYLVLAATAATLLSIHAGTAPAHLVGQPLLIHAGTRPVVGRLGYNRADQIDWWRSVCRDAGADAPPMCDVDAVRGHIVAMAVPDDSYDAGLANSRWAEVRGWWTPLYDVVALPTPIPYRGGQGLRRAPPELVELVLGQVAP